MSARLCPAPGLTMVWVDGALPEKSYVMAGPTTVTLLMGYLHRSGELLLLIGSQPRPVASAPEHWRVGCGNGKNGFPLIWGLKRDTRVSKCCEQVPGRRRCS